METGSRPDSFMGGTSWENAIADMTHLGIKVSVVAKKG
jgi:hypothetical protein